MTSIQHTQDYCYDPTAAEWEAFLAKTAYTRVFRDHTFGGGGTRLSEAAVTRIARSRPYRTIFPNLRVFHMTSSGTRKILMSPSVVEFVWRVDTTAATASDEMTRLCTEVADAMPNIETLRIQAKDIEHVHDHLARLFQSLPRLRRLILPLYGLTATLFHALSSVHTLRSIDFEKSPSVREQTTEHPSTSPIGAFSVASMTFPSPTFPSLTHLALAIPDFDSLHELLESSAIRVVTQLVRLVVRIPFVEAIQGNKIYQFLQMLSVHASSLEELALYLAPSRREDIELLRLSNPIGLCDIEPFTGIIRLTSFTIHLGKPLALSDMDMEELSLSLPNIKTLVLNPHPALDEASDATFASLTPFVRFCPQLRDLGLYLDGTADFTWRSDPAFQPSFRTLRLGRSRLPGADDPDKRHRLAMCIGDLIPRTATVICLYSNDVMDCADFSTRGVRHSKHPMCLYWYDVFRSDWMDIWMMAQAVADERALPWGEREVVERGFEMIQGYVPWII